MHLPIALFVLTFLAAQSPTIASQGEGSSGKTQSGQEASSSEKLKEGGKPVTQLSQYPGAPFEDPAGNLWFSTVTQGVIRYDGERFVNFTIKDGLAGNIVRDIVIGDGGKLWMATNGGVSVYDGTGFTTLWIDFPKGQFQGNGGKRGGARGRACR